MRGTTNMVAALVLVAFSFTTGHIVGAAREWASCNAAQTLKAPTAVMGVRG